MKLTEYPSGVINGFDGLRVIVDLDKETSIATLVDVVVIPAPIAEAADAVIVAADAMVDSCTTSDGIEVSPTRSSVEASRDAIAKYREVTK